MWDPLGFSSLVQSNARTTGLLGEYWEVWAPPWIFLGISNVLWDFLSQEAGHGNQEALIEAYGGVLVLGTVMIPI